MNKKRLLPFAISLFIAFFFIAIIFVTMTTHAVYPMHVLNDDWTISVNGVSHENVSLDKMYKILDPALVRGDRIIMTTTLPDSEFIPSAVILFQSRYFSFHMYVDSREVFSFGDAYYSRNKFLGKMYHIISLPTDYPGKELKIDLRIAENDPFIRFIPPTLGSHDDVAGDFVHSNLFVIATGFFTFIFGVSFLCIALLFVTRISEAKSLLFGAVFCINMGVWLFSYYDLLSMFVYTLEQTTIEYITLYLLVPFCYLIIYYLMDLKGHRGFVAIMTVSCVIPVVQLFLHYLAGIHLRDTLIFCHLNGIVGFVVLTYYSIKGTRQKSIPASSITQMTGLFTFCVCEVLHLLIYVLTALHIQTIEIANKIIICGGCFIFVICQLATYMTYITDSYARKRENVSLSHLAYADGLTNLANRSRSDMLMEELDNSDDDYCIISIDLNGLKAVNDKFGHPAGDKYIKEFANVLTTTFGDNGFCARIGGDEFLVVIRDTASTDINSLIDRMNSAINVMNALYTEYKRSVATGYAFRHECENGDSHEVYLLADQRMYELKRKMHEELGIHTRL